jgi:hypothetical protein
MPEVRNGHHVYITGNRKLKCQDVGLPLFQLSLLFFTEHLENFSVVLNVTSPTYEPKYGHDHKTNQSFVINSVT